MIETFFFFLLPISMLVLWIAAHGAVYWQEREGLYMESVMVKTQQKQKKGEREVG